MPMPKAVNNEPILDAPKPRRRWGRLAILTLVTLMVLVALGPTILSFAPCLNFVIGLATHKLHGKITTQGASLGWFSQPVVYGLEILPENGPPLVKIPRAECDRTLWQIAWQPSELGKLTADNVDVRVVVHQKETVRGTNFGDVFAPPPEQVGKPSPFLNWLKGRHVGAKVTNVTVHWMTPGASREWSIDQLSASGELQPGWMSASGAPELHVDKQTFLDHRELSSGMCNDVLKFIVPTLFGDKTRAEGQISVVLDDCRLPLDKEKIKEGHLSGTLTLHTVEVGSGGKIVTTISDLFKLPPEVEIAHESAVQFELHQGRVYHRDLEVGISGMRLRTSGSVGLDETLDLAAEVYMKLSDKTNADRPLLSALGRQTLRLPIGGTLEKPEINLKETGQSALGAVKGTLNELGRDGEQPVTELLKMLREKISPAKSSPEEAAADGKPDGDKPAKEGIGAQIMDRAGPVLDQLLKNRRDRQKKRQEAEGNK
jgi:hypothetical protein